jgi:hypothetical protein
MSEPAAQLGASFLRLFRSIVFDQIKTVWLNLASKTMFFADGYRPLS